ncbi:MAG TPA: UDP-N-acetylglucosamine 1-carboxyvinyltransferase [Anaerolineales bacterium]|nr:UDP-N-acetylglucosamine 1-carboxyvinyltransferase [Anaerolineae bacterium]HIQ02643.1 UDP-N-acetylglucosamine 1-carboxyvinyltransferase [Anaerolineales bacterium]
MEELIIEGGHPLQGTLTPSGNKNAALPALAACLLTDEPVVLRNLPDIQDVWTMGELLADIGVQVEQLDPHTWRLHAREVRLPAFDRERFRRIRGSILLAGPMLTRLGQVELPPPGGDVIGRRRVDTHFLAFRELGAEVDVNDLFRLRALRLRGADILLDQASVTGTENAIMAAVLATGTTVIRNAASEPHVQDLCHMLNRLGAQIEGIGSNLLTIHGVDRLRGGEFTIGPDHMEVGSYIAMAAMTRGEVRIRDAAPHHLRMIRYVFERLGVRVEVEGEDIHVPADQPLRVVPDLGGAIPTIADAPWPAFPADLMSIAIVLATQVEGTVLFHEKMFESRLYFVDKLIFMGARIVLCDPHRCVVQGPSPLHGDVLVSPDIRAGMALMGAALCARGQSIIRNVNQIDRGYERVEEKLRSLGGRIERVRR